QRGRHATIVGRGRGSAPALRGHRRTARPAVREDVAGLRQGTGRAGAYHRPVGGLALIAGPGHSRHPWSHSGAHHCWRRLPVNELTERLIMMQPIVMGGAVPTVEELRDRTSEMG